MEPFYFNTIEQMEEDILKKLKTSKKDFEKFKVKQVIFCPYEPCINYWEDNSLFHDFHLICKHNFTSTTNIKMINNDGSIIKNKASPKRHHQKPPWVWVPIRYHPSTDENFIEKLSSL